MPGRHPPRRRRRRDVAAVPDVTPALKPADFIATHPVFRLDEFRANHAKLGRGPVATRALLAYHLGRKRIRVLRRGLYAHPRDTDAWLVGSRMTPDAVLAYGGALSFHGVTGLGHLLPYLTATPRPRFEWNEVVYQAVRADRLELESRVDEVTRRGLPVRVTSVERALVDVMERPHLGPIEEVVETLRTSRSFDRAGVLAVAGARQSKALNARLGYVLSFRPDTSWRDVHRLETRLPVVPVRLAPPRDPLEELEPEPCTLIPRWRVRVARGLRRLVERQGW